MTPFERLGYDVYGKFVVTEGNGFIDKGDIVTLKNSNDNSDCPWFWTEDKSDFWSIDLSQIEPYEEKVMTPCEEKGYEVGQVFKDNRDGELLVLIEDDGSAYPRFLGLEDGIESCLNLRKMTRIYPTPAIEVIETINLFGKDYPKTEIESALKDVLPVSG